jgi:hypothetical protein
MAHAPRVTPRRTAPAPGPTAPPLRPFAGYGFFPIAPIMAYV